MPRTEVGISEFSERLWKKYMARCGYEWNGYTAPELTPQVQSRQVLALAEMVEELEARVQVLEDLRRLDSGVSPSVIAKERFGR